MGHKNNNAGGPYQYQGAGPDVSGPAPSLDARPPPAAAVDGARVEEEGGELAQVEHGEGIVEHLGNELGVSPLIVYSNDIRIILEALRKRVESSDR